MKNAENLAVTVFDWVRGLHAHGMSIHALVIEVVPWQETQWQVRLCHSGMGGYSSPQTCDDAHLNLATPKPPKGVSMMIISKPADKTMALGSITFEEALSIAGHLAPAVGAHDIWESERSINMATYALDLAIRGELSPQKAEKLIAGTHKIRNGTLVPRKEKPSKESPVKILGRRLVVLRPCGCITEHFKAPRKGLYSPSRHKFGLWLTTVPCLKCLKNHDDKNSQ